MPELSDQVQAEIRRLCALGDVDADQARYPEALGAYWSAWDLLPEPKLDCEAATWILAAVGDVNFLGGDYIAGRDNLSTVMHCPGALGIPFLHMRLGQCQYELGDQAQAIRELKRAYLGGGAHLFDDEDAKYTACLPANVLDGSIDRKNWRFWK